MTIEYQFRFELPQGTCGGSPGTSDSEWLPALVPSHSTKACRIAQDEIEAGKISYVKKDVPVVKPLVQKAGIPILLERDSVLTDMPEHGLHHPCDTLHRSDGNAPSGDLSRRVQVALRLQIRARFP